MDPTAATPSLPRPSQGSSGGPLSDSRRALPALAVLISLLVAGCSGERSAGDGEVRRGSGSREGPPVILITFEGLRAAEVGALQTGDARSDAARSDAARSDAPRPSATPALDGLMREADWAGRGVASSSLPGPAGASLATGLGPWKHQLLLPGERLAPELITLAEAFSSLGFHTSGYLSGPSLSTATGFQQGFDFFRTLRRGHGARSHLRGLQGGPELVWIHLQHPAPPWERRDWLFPDARVPAGIPERVGTRELSRWSHPSAGGAGPSTPPPADLRRSYQTLYRNNASLGDVFLGRFLEDLRNSGHWDEIVLAVTSTHGQEVGEAGWIGHGGELSRRLLEVPLVLKLPEGTSRPLPEPGERVATARLWATLVEAAGGRAPPGVAPSLFHPAPVPGILSELYGAGGENRVSLLEGDLQLVHRTVYGRAGAQASGPAAFRLTPPLTGPPGRGGVTERSLWRWVDEPGEPGARRRVEDREVEGRLHRRLLEAWSEFLPAEEPPAVAAEDLSIER